MNNMQTKTSEERKAIAAKGHATRRARVAAEKQARKDAITYAGGLREEIEKLESRISSLNRMEVATASYARLTGKRMLRSDEIASLALPWDKPSGVYFLLLGDEVVYVGQAVNVYARIGQHVNKQFDRYAFIPCPIESLDRVESLYIHYLRPKLNGIQANGANCAPIPFDTLLGVRA